MTVIPGKTYAELAIAGTLATRYDSWNRSLSSPGGSGQEVFAQPTAPLNIPAPYIWIDTSNSKIPVLKYDDGGA